VSGTSEILFEYLRDMFYNPSKAVLDIEKLDGDFVMLGKGLIYFAECFSQYNELAKALAKGDLSVPLPPPENELAAPLKSLHASLRHLTWQTQQVAMGDYTQHVDFMGEFSNAFNMMIEQLSERQKKLEAEIETTCKKSAALEQSNQLLTNITRYIPQQIIVIDMDTREILLMNDIAKNIVDSNAEYMQEFMRMIFERKDADTAVRHNIEIRYNQGGDEHYLSVSAYHFEWSNSNAEAFVINDISNEKARMKELEAYAYQDTMTHLYNRFYGMITLNKWLDSKEQFALIFVDLDNLKYINDKFGHTEGDVYIINASRYLKAFSSDAVVCRIGGDEFMLLAPGIGYEDAYKRMNEIYRNIQNDNYLEDKNYFYSISFGIVAVDKDTTLPSSDILSLADERMYEHKRLRKKSRKA